MSQPLAEVILHVTDQTTLFEAPNIVERRGALKSASSVPLPEDASYEFDQMVKGTFVGNIKGIVGRRMGAEAGSQVITYEVEIVELYMQPSDDKESR